MTFLYQIAQWAAWGFGFGATWAVLDELSRRWKATR